MLTAAADSELHNENRTVLKACKDDAQRNTKNVMGWPGLCANAVLGQQQHTRNKPGHWTHWLNGEDAGSESRNGM